MSLKNIVKKYAPLVLIPMVMSCERNYKTIMGTPTDVSINGEEVTFTIRGHKVVRETKHAEKLYEHLVQKLPITKEFISNLQEEGFDFDKVVNLMKQMYNDQHDSLAVIEAQLEVTKSLFEKFKKENEG